MQTLNNEATLRRAYGYAGALAVIWLVAASLRPSTTYHLAPLLVAAAVPFVVAADARAPTARRLIGAAAGGGTLALVVTGVLTVAGRLEGPSLLPFGGAVTESVVFALVGAAVGLGAAAARSQR